MKFPIGASLARAAFHSISALVWMLNASLLAQDKPPETEMQKWLATTDAQWQAAFKRDVADVREFEFSKLRLQYLTMLEAATARASSAGDLDGALALRNEQRRFGDTNTVPAQDDPADPASFKQMRATMRAQLARFENDHAARAKALLAKYDQYLDRAQVQLTQRGDIDNAVLIKNKRVEVAAAWIGPASTAAGAAASPAAAPPVAAAPPASLGAKTGAKLAQVESAGTTLVPFALGAKVWSDRAVVFTEVSPGFEDSKFTQSAAHAATLRFKVLSDGLVRLVCASRFLAKKGESGWESEVFTERMLEQKNWHRERKTEFKHTGADHVWWLFTRQCNAGEEFTIRNDKYAAPFLLVN